MHVCHEYIWLFILWERDTWNNKGNWSYLSSGCLAEQDELHVASSFSTSPLCPHISASHEGCHFCHNDLWKHLNFHHHCFLKHVFYFLCKLKLHSIHYSVTKWVPFRYHEFTSDFEYQWLCNLLRNYFEVSELHIYKIIYFKCFSSEKDCRFNIKLVCIKAYEHIYTYFYPHSSESLFAL